METSFDQPQPWRSDMPKERQAKSFRVPSSIIDNESYTTKNIPDAPDLPCIVCYNQLAAGVYTDCPHRVVCLQCAEGHFIAAMQANETPKCLVSACQAPFLESSQSIFHYFDQKTRIKWRTHQKKHMMRKQNLGKQVYRACQFPNCQGFVDPKKYQCVICQQKHCQYCKRLEHQGQCQSQSFIQGDLQIKRCKLCQGRIYKEGGCSRVVCQACNRSICYECGDEWSYLHHGCQSGGWLRLPYYFFSQRCCSKENVVDGFK